MRLELVLQVRTAAGAKRQDTVGLVIDDTTGNVTVDAGDRAKLAALNVPKPGQVVGFVAVP